MPKLEYCAVGMRYSAGLSENVVPPMTNANVPEGLLSNLASPVRMSVEPPPRRRNSSYAREGM